MYSPYNGGRAPGRAGKINLKVVGCAGAALAVLCLLVGGGGVAGYYFWYKPRADEEARQAERQRLHDALTPELSAYLNLKTNPPGPGPKKFKGKVVCVDKEKKEIDTDAQVALPNALKATRPDEVAAVAWLSWSEDVGGEYPDGAKAMIHVVRVTLIDMRTETFLVFQKEIRGDTLEKKLGGGDRLGPKPLDKIAAMLQEFAESN